MVPDLNPATALFAFAASHKALHFLFHLGLVGLFVISSVDSSFIPLPIPGVTDIMRGAKNFYHE